MVIEILWICVLQWEKKFCNVRALVMAMLPGQRLSGTPIVEKRLSLLICSKRGCLHTMGNYGEAQ